MCVQGDFILLPGAKVGGGDAATDIKTEASGERQGQQKEEKRRLLPSYLWATC